MHCILHSSGMQYHVDTDAVPCSTHPLVVLVDDISGGDVEGHARHKQPEPARALLRARGGGGGGGAKGGLSRLQCMQEAAAVCVSEAAREEGPAHQTERAAVLAWKRSWLHALGLETERQCPKGPISLTAETLTGCAMAAARTQKRMARVRKSRLSAKLSASVPTQKTATRARQVGREWAACG